MLRLRHPPLDAAFCAGVLIACLALPVPHAGAQSEYGASVLRPELDGDPNNPQRFRRTDGNQASAATARFSTPSGAGATGFDSTNARKKKEKDKAKPKTKKSTTTTSTFAAPPVLPVPKTAVPPIPRGLERRGATPYMIQRSPYDPPIDDGTPKRRRVPPDDNPFDPIGIQVGAFNFKPAIEATTGHDSNPTRTSTATPSWYSVVAPELKFNSNWGRHEFTGDLRGSYSVYKEVPSQNRPSFDGKLTGRVDVTRDTRIDLETRFLVGTDNPGSPNIQAGLSRLPIFTTLGGTAGFGHRFNRFDVSIKAGADRTVYQESTFTDGSTQSNDDRNYNRYLTTLRGSYELTPGVKPFVEVGADRRVHDIDVDLSGTRRNSDGQYIKAGTTFELTRILTGEVAVGWLARRYEDRRLDGISGLTLDGSLVWVASALTTAKLTARTTVEESTVLGVSGMFSREVALQVDHAFRRWLIGTLKFTRGFDDYVGLDRSDDRYSASVGIVYKLNREWQLKSELRRDWLRSNVSGVDYNANVILFGLRLAR